MTKLEASLQALYTGMDLPVLMMSETLRLAKHGLVLSSKSTKKLKDLKTAAVRQAASGNLSATQLVASSTTALTKLSWQLLFCKLYHMLLLWHLLHRQHWQP